MKQSHRLLSLLLAVVMLIGIAMPMGADALTPISTLTFNYSFEEGERLHFSAGAGNHVSLLQCDWRYDDSNRYFNDSLTANQKEQYELFFQVQPEDGYAIINNLQSCTFNGVSLSKNAALPLGSFRQMGDNSVQVRVRFSYLKVVDKAGHSVDGSNITGFHIQGETLDFSNINCFNDNGHFSNYTVSGDAKLKTTTAIAGNTVTMGADASTITANFNNHKVYKNVITKSGFDKEGSYVYACSECSFKDIGVHSLSAVDMELEGFEEHGASSKTLYYNGKNQYLGVDLYFEGRPLSESEYSIKYPAKSSKVGSYEATVSVFGTYFEDSLTYSYHIYLGKPKVSATVSANAVKLTWKKVTGATKYRVYGYNLKTGKYTRIADTTKLTYTRTGRAGGTAYAYLVRALFVQSGKEVLSPYTKKDNVNVVTLCAAPKVKAAVSGKTVTLKWAKISGTKFYRVYQYNAKTKKYNTLVNSTGKVSVKLTKQAKGTHYYLVRAFNKAGNGSKYTTKNLVKAVVR